MSYFRHNWLFCAFFCIIFAGCSKSSHSDNIPSGPTIYIAGDNGVDPVLWENGNSTVLSSSGGSASQVVVSGNAVYVAGVSGEGTSPSMTPAGPFGQYGYWKNGVQNNIGNFELLGPTPGASISVSGGSVYFSDGYFWKNGSKLTLQDQSIYNMVTSTFASGSDIYAVGSDNNDNAVYWKNGVVNVLAQSNSQTAPGATCIYVSGSDIYIGGFGLYGVPLYWKNGVATYLQVADSGRSISRIDCIFVSGDDVYIVGNTYGNGVDGYLAPAYWKNGVEVDLPLNGATYGVATAIFVSGTDVYVSGSTAAGAVFWKNGIETILSSKGSANSIYFQ